jgi:cyclophilin family peptidyl-prolyl cis-trans isomerase
MRIPRAIPWVVLAVAACIALPLGVSATKAPTPPRVAVDTSVGRFTLELDTERAPRTVANFLAYVDDGFYDGLIFHRVIRATLIQGGGYTPQLEPRATRAAIPSEAAHALPNLRYTIGMARGLDPDGATSQFYVNLRDNPDLDVRPGGRSGYCAFGRVIDGTAVVDSIGRVRTTMRAGRWQQPVAPVVIVSMHRLDDVSAE